MKNITFKYESCENGKQEKLVKTLDLETVLGTSDLPEENKYTNAVLTLSNFVEEFVNHIGFSIIPLMNDEFVEQKEDLNLEEFVRQFSESKSFQMKVFEIFKESME
jgi:hypothetical protein